jgi:hypothetical protein
MSHLLSKDEELRPLANDLETISHMPHELALFSTQGIDREQSDELCWLQDN